MKKKLKVEIEWRLLERIAQYYEFPSAIFLGNISNFPKCKTRNENFKHNSQLYNKIKEIVIGDDSNEKK